MSGPTLVPGALRSQRDASTGRGASSRLTTEPAKSEAVARPPWVRCETERMDARPFEALLLVSFGGPERPEDVMPFLENVTAGRGIPRDRLADVGRHYELFGGVSPINRLNRELLDAIRLDF